MKKMAGILRIVLTSRWVQYVFFWGFSFVILARYFSYGPRVESIDVIYTALFHISLLFAVCMNSYLLIPKFLAGRNYAGYGAGLAAVLFSAVWLNILTFQHLADWIFPGYYFISYFEWTDILQFLITYVSITSLLQLSRSWFREMEARKTVESLEKEKVSSELKALKAQINPHFLFNSLNHVYAMAVRQSPETGPAILQLSDLLRYVIRNTNRETVSLQDEIEYLEKYIGLHKSRLHHPDRVRFTVNGNPGSLQIAPLLLIVFVENCFKHGSTKQQNDMLTIKLDIEKPGITLLTENAVNETGDLPGSSNGTGLENAKRRLNLLYSGRHTLDIVKKSGRFSIKLNMELA